MSTIIHYQVKLPFLKSKVERLLQKLRYKNINDYIRDKLIEDGIGLL